MSTLLLAVIYLSFIALGLPDALTGAGWPAMHLSLGASVGDLGVVTMLISGCTVVSSLVSDALSRRFGAYAVTAASIFLTAAAVFGFSAARAFWQILLLAVPYGLGAGAIDAVLNGYVALHDSSRHLNWLHCFWGVGSILGPFAMSFALTHAGWRGGYRIVAAALAVIGLIVLLSRSLWQSDRPSPPAPGQRKERRLAAALGKPGAKSLLLGFFAYCSAESTVMAWAATYLSRTHGLAKPEAAALASLFFIGLTVGRFLAGFVSDRLGDRAMIRFGLLLSLCGIGCLLCPVFPRTLRFAGFVIAGLGCASVYPSVIHHAPAQVGTELSGSFIGVLMASAYTGSTFLPPIFGALGDAAGFGTFPWFLLFFLALTLLLTESAFRRIA